MTKRNTNKTDKLSNEAKMVQMLAEGATETQIQIEFLKRYAGKDAKYVAKRIKIYKRIASKQVSELRYFPVVIQVRGAEPASYCRGWTRKMGALTQGSELDRKPGLEWTGDVVRCKPEDAYEMIEKAMEAAIERGDYRIRCGEFCTTCR